MGQAAAKKGDRITATDTHIVMVPSAAGPVPTPMPLPFTGVLDGGLSSSVQVDDAPVAVDGSTATNQPGHVPLGGTFQRQPSDRATVNAVGAVLAEGKPIAKNGDPAITCNDPADLAVGVVIATGTVMVGS